MGTISAIPEDTTPSHPDATDATATNISCDNCAEGILLIRDDGYAYCPDCDRKLPPRRTLAARGVAGETTITAHRSRYPERIEPSDVFSPKVELAAAASDAAHAANDADYVAYQQRYSAAVQPATAVRPRQPTPMPS